MRKLIAAAGLLALGFALGYVVDSRSAQRAQGTRIVAVKYAYVVGVNDKALICFAEAEGCRMQEVTSRRS